MSKQYLMHYASVYYDPVKAHEYYMKNRELKGRRKGTLNEEGQAAKKMVKANLDAERDSKLKGIYSARESNIQTAKTNQEQSLKKEQETMITSLEQAQEARAKDIENHANYIRNEIQSIMKSSQSENLSDGQKEMMLQKIASLREENYKKRESISQQFNKKYETIANDYGSKVNDVRSKYQSDVASAKTNASNQKNSTKEEYKNKYEAELDKIYADSRFLKTKKSKSSGNSSSSKPLRALKTKSDRLK